MIPSNTPRGTRVIVHCAETGVARERVFERVLTAPRDTGWCELRAPHGEFERWPLSTVHLLIDSPDPATAREAWQLERLERIEIAARGVEEWWLTLGMQRFSGAPLAMFALRYALGPSEDPSEDAAEELSTGGLLAAEVLASITRAQAAEAASEREEYDSSTRFGVQQNAESAREAACASLLALIDTRIAAALAACGL